MCLIIYRDKKQTLSDEFLKDVFTRNPHGWGIMYNSVDLNNSVVTKRGLDFDSFLKVYRELESNKNQRMVVHFRMATHGAKTVKNCHPFKVVDGVYMMHNGIIDIEIPKEEAETHSDTRVFVRDVLRPLLTMVNNIPLFLRSNAFKNIMTTYCESHNSRIAIMDWEGPVFFGPWYQTETDVWVSNTYAYRVDNKTWAKYNYNTKKPQVRYNQYGYPEEDDERMAGYDKSDNAETIGRKDGNYDAYNNKPYEPTPSMHGFTEIHTEYGEYISQVDQSKGMMSGAAAYRKGYYLGFNTIGEKSKEYSYDQLDEALTEAMFLPEDPSYDDGFSYLTIEELSTLSDWLTECEVPAHNLNDTLAACEEGKMYFVTTPNNRIIDRDGNTVFPFYSPIKPLVKQEIKDAKQQ